MKLDNWQQEVLSHDGDLLLCTGRRVGKTYILSRKAIDLMAKKPRTPIVIVSLTEDQAMIILSMALNYAKEAYPHLLGKKGKDKPTLKSLVLNGGKMVVRPIGNTGDGVRGFEGGVLIVDEAARASRFFWIAAKQILLTTNGQIWIASTPFGKQGYFWERYDEVVNKKREDSRFRVFAISTEEVMRTRDISASWTEEQRAGALRILKEDEKEMSIREFQQEYGGKFIDELSNYYNEDLVMACCKLERKSPQKGRRYYLGVDIARMGEDRSAFEIIDGTNPKLLEQAESITTRKTLTTATQARIQELDNIWLFTRKGIGIDAGSGSLGVGVYDNLLQIPSIRWKIVPMNNRKLALDREGKEKQAPFKEDMYGCLRALMERGEIKMLADEHVIQSLLSVQYEYVVGGDKKAKLRIFSPHHADSDIVEGIIRAVWLASRNKQLNIRIDY